MAKVAIIEDEPEIAEMYRLKLQGAGYDVRVAYDGQEGLELAEKWRPDVILLDLMMPVMSGEQMLKELRQTKWGADILVIILTNLTKDVAPNSLGLLDVKYYIVKAHYSLAQIIEIVGEVLAKHKSKHV